MASKAPYEGSGGGDGTESPPCGPASVSAVTTAESIPSRSSTRRRKSPSPPSSPTTSFSSELCNDHESGRSLTAAEVGSINGDSGHVLPHAGDGRHVSVSQSTCNFVMGKSKALVFGQFLAFVLAGTGAIQSSLHLECNLSAPTFSMFSFYFPLTVACLARLIWKEKGPALLSRWKERGQGILSRLRRTSIRIRLSRNQSSASLSDQDGLSMPREGSVENAEIDTSDARNGNHPPPENVWIQQPPDRRGKIPTIRAKPEKRNQLLSRWMDHPPSLHVLEGLYVDDNDERFNEEQTAPPPLEEERLHSFFGLFPVQTPLRNYATIALVDVYANYCTILAFKYTTITNVQLFDALAIPSAITVSKLFFGRRYTKLHLLGVMICSIGIVINFVQNYREDKHLREVGDDEETAQELMIEEDYPYKIRGDFLAICGGILFGIDNTIQEVAVKDSTLVEYLGCMTFFASIISFFQALILERHAIVDFFTDDESDTCPESQGWLLFFLFSFGGIITYAGIGIFLQFSDAAFLNLSLLTADAWAVAYSVFEEGIIPPATFYVALVITISGVFIYEMAPSPCPVAENIVGEIELAETDADGRREEYKDEGHVLT